MKTRLLTFIIAFITAVSAWANYFKYGDLYYYITDETNKTVTVINERQDENNYSSLSEAVTIPENVIYSGKQYRVTGIGPYAFARCSALTQITIPNSVTSIGEYAFAGCSALQDITIPNSVTSIGDAAFLDCYALKEINVESSNIAYCSKDGVLFNKDKTTLIRYPSSKVNTSYTIPNSVIFINSYAFEVCIALTKIIIPNSVTSIGDYAFAVCALQDITIPNSVTSIGEYTFIGCSALTQMTVLAIEPPAIVGSDTDLGISSDIPVYVPKQSLNKYISSSGWSNLNLNGLIHKYDNLYYNITDYTNMTAEVAYEYQDENNYSSLPAVVTIPETVNLYGDEYRITGIGSNAFNGCSTLTQIIIPNSVTSIGYRAFWGCSALQDITIPNSVTSIKSEAFNSCSVLKEINVESENTAYCSEDGVLFNKDKTTLIQYPIGKTNASYTIPNSVTNIGDRAFESCNTLTQITITKNVTSIGFDTFYKCNALTQMTVLATEPPELSYDPILSSYSGISYKTPIYVHKQALEKYKIGNGWKRFDLQELTYEYENLYYNITELTNMTAEVTYESYMDENNYSSLPAVVTIPGTVNFYGDEYRITGIGENAFYGCNRLTQVTIPKSVTNIGENAFYRCSALKEINVENDNTVYCSEDGVLFNKDKTTLIQYPSSKENTSYTIPNSVTNIGEKAFEGCSALTQITITKNVTSIGNSAFSDCNALTQMTVLAPEPPASSNLGINSKIPVYVHKQALEKYKIDNGWKDFNLQELTYEYENLYYNITDLTNMTAEVTYESYMDENNYSSLPAVVTIPETVNFYGDEYRITGIGEYAFYKCSRLTQVTIPKSVANIGENVFYRCSALKEINVENDNTVYCSEDGVLFNKDKNTLIQYPSCKENTSYIIPNSVTNIESYAFSDCSTLKEITIGNRVTNIEEKAFGNCRALTQMTVLATEPPALRFNTFDGVSRSIPVYVPDESLDFYKSTGVWNEFNLQGISTGIMTPSLPESITICNGMIQNPQALKIDIYDLQGRIIYSGDATTFTMPEGIYIIRCGEACGKVIF